MDWAWRIPFFIPVLLVVLGFWTRRRVEESSAFVEFVHKAGSVERSPLSYAVHHNRPELLKAFFVKASENTFLYIFSTFVLLLTTTHLHIGRADALRAVLWARAAEVFVTLAAAAVSDRIGRRPVLLVGFVLLCLASHGITLGAMAAYMTELFPTRVRYMAFSMSYQLASVAGGAIAPLVGAMLMHYTGTSVSVAIYASLMAVPAILCVLKSREAKGADFFAADSAETDAVPEMQASTPLERGVAQGA